MKRFVSLIILLFPVILLNAYIFNAGIGYGSLSAALHDDDIRTGIEYGIWGRTANYGIDTTTITSEFFSGIYFSPMRNVRMGIGADIWAVSVSSLFDLSYSVDGFESGDFSGGIILKGLTGYGEYFYKEDKNDEAFRWAFSFKGLISVYPDIKYFSPDTSESAFDIMPFGSFDLGGIFAAEVGSGPFHGIMNAGYIAEFSPVYGNSANTYLLSLGGGIYFYPYIFTYISYNLRTFNNWFEFGISLNNDGGRYNIFLMYPSSVNPFAPFNNTASSWIIGLSVTTAGFKTKKKEKIPQSPIVNDTTAQLPPDTIVIEKDVKYDYKNVIMGVIKDEKGNPLSNVKIMCNGIEYYTKEDGSFYMQIKGSKEFLVSCEKDGYKIYREHFTLKKGEGKTLEITLKEAGDVYDIMGRVRYNGAPVGVTIEVIPKVIHQVFSDPKTGIYKMKLPVGEYVLKVLSSEYEYSEPLIVKNAPIIKNINLKKKTDITFTSQTVATVSEYSGNIYISDGKLIIPPIEFFEGSVNLKDAAYANIKEIASFLLANKTVKIRIESHIDAYSEAKYGDITYKRACAIKDVLISFGIDKNRIECKGMGSLYPISDLNTKEGRKQNNRIEISIIQ